METARLQTEVELERWGAEPGWWTESQRDQCHPARRRIILVLILMLILESCF
jgi:hypothetical protein